MPSDDEPLVTTIPSIPFTEAMILPPPPNVCVRCAVDHLPEAPHNPDSLHYQYWFYQQEMRAGREGRWPTWADAMAHCDEDMQTLWTDALAERGVIV